MKRWTKKSIREMRAQIDHFVLRYDLPGNLTTRPGAAERRARLRDAIDRARKAIVIGGLTAFRKMIADRANENEKAADHFRKTRVYRDATDEMVERFTKLANDDRKGAEYIEKLVARIEREGLPPEVAEYMPERIQE